MYHMKPGVAITGLRDRDANDGIGDVSFTIIVAVCSAVAAFTIVIAGVIYHRLQVSDNISINVLQKLTSTASLQ